ncbi:MAG: protealysin inhibitor emfourin [Acidimicrobiia bacterium]
MSHPPPDPPDTPDPAGATRVVFRQTGGFTGRILGIELDASDLSAEEVSALEWLLRHVDEHAGRPASGAHRDVENYEIRVQGQSADRCFTFAGVAVPERVGPLLDRLRRDATPRPLR